GRVRVLSFEKERTKENFNDHILLGFPLRRNGKYEAKAALQGTDGIRPLPAIYQKTISEHNKGADTIRPFARFL
ncbi:MAG: hypothetical protein RR092_06445, partial [Oscillospiraceae bacterium]